MGQTFSWVCERVFLSEEECIVCFFCFFFEKFQSLVALYMYILYLIGRVYREIICLLRKTIGFASLMADLRMSVVIKHRLM